MALQKILVVDDEPSVLALVSRALISRGYEVVAVDCPLNALALAQGTPFDLVVSDVDMPIICGTELVRQILKVWPYLPVVFMSGSPITEIFPTQIEFLSKPFALGDLFAVVERALASRDSEPEALPPLAA